MHHQRHQKVDGPMSEVLKFPAFNLARTHQTRRHTPLQDLNVGLLIQRQDHFVTLKQPCGPFVEPQNARRSFLKLSVQGRRLPVPRAMRLQRSRAQNQRDRSKRDARHQASLDRDARQRPCRPMGHVQTDAGRCAAGQLLNPNPFQGGKSPTVGQSVEHQRALQGHQLRSVDRVSKWRLA